MCLSVDKYFKFLEKNRKNLIIFMLKYFLPRQLHLLNFFPNKYKFEI